MRALNNGRSLILAGIAEPKRANGEELSNKLAEPPGFWCFCVPAFDSVERNAGQASRALTNGRSLILAEPKRANGEIGMH